jgi:hypothetical protein
LKVMGGAYSTLCAIQGADNRFSFVRGAAPF